MNLYFTPETYTPVDHFTRDVQIDREEFLRQLPDAVDKRQFEIDGDIISIPEKDGAVHIRITDLGVKEMGELKLPMLRLDFAFQNMRDEDIDAFMDIYEQRTLRGSGGM